MIEPALLISMSFLASSWMSDIWYAAWLLAVVSLVWSATRFEQMNSILRYSVSCAVRMVIVLLAAMLVLMLLNWKI